MQELIDAVKEFWEEVEISSRKLGRREYCKFATPTGDNIWIWNNSGIYSISIGLESADANGEFAELLNLILEYFDTQCRVFRHKIVSKYFLCNLEGRVISDIPSLQKVAQIPVSRFDGKTMWDLVGTEYNLAPINP